MFDKFSINEKYWNKLVGYSEIFSKQLKLAIYWSRWNIWSLVDSSQIPNMNGKYTLFLEDAFKKNEMRYLGDQLIGINPPLIMKILSDPNCNRKFVDDKVSFKIEKVEFYSRDIRIEKPTEKNIAFSFMMFGDWQDGEPVQEIVNDELISISFIAEPIQQNVSNKFSLIGSLSGMISRQFNFITAPEGEIEYLSPKLEKSHIGQMIPKDYKGDVLKIWRLNQKPNLEKTV